MSGDDPEINRRDALRGTTAGLGALVGLGLGVDSAAADPIGDDVLPTYTNCTQATNPYQHFLYLDGSCKEADGNRVKTYPDHREYAGDWREWQSPLRGDGDSKAGYHRAFTSVQTAKHTADTQALDAVVDGGLPDGLQVALIDVERDADGTPFYRYFLGDDDQPAKESWSESKFMAAAAAGAEIRRESDNAVGLDSVHEGTHVGRLITKIHNYGTEMDEDLPWSNGLATFLLNVAGTDWTTELVRDWTGSPTSEFTNGPADQPSYDEPTFESPAGDTATVWNPSPMDGNKHITRLASAEFLKRLVMHREDSATRVPGFRADGDHSAYWEDLKTLFYGEPSTNHGGMMDDIAIYTEGSVQLDPLDGLDALADGDWRIFSKLGYGFNEFVYTAYACLPDEDDPTSGSEFVVSVHWDRDTSISGTDKDAKLQDVLQQIVTAVRTGEIEDYAESPPTADFPDVVDHWAETEIRTLVDEGVLDGYDDGTIRPDTPITLAEFAVLLRNAFHPGKHGRPSSGDDSGKGPRSDAPGDDRASQAIQRAADAGVLSGSANGTFRPDQTLTKTQALAVLVLGVDSLPETASTSYLDRFADRSKIPDWGKDAVAAAEKAGLVENYPLSRLLEPNAEVTRAEAMKYVYEATR